MTERSFLPGDKVVVGDNRPITFLFARTEFGRRVAYCEYFVGGYRTQCRVDPGELKPGRRQDVARHN